MHKGRVLSPAKRLVVFAILLTTNVLAGYPVKIGFYNSTGTGDFDKFLIDTMALGATKAFGENGFTITNITERDVNNVTLKLYDVIVFPGGSGSAQAEAVGEDGLKALYDFVSNGGGYIGTCGGAFLALGHIKLYGPGPNGRGPKIQLHEGEGPVQMAFNEDGITDLNLDYNVNQNITIQYYSGPIIKDEDFPSDVSIWAHFKSEVQSGSHWMSNTVSISGRKLNKGRIVLNSPHPELVPNYPDIYGHELVWLLE